MHYNRQAYKLRDFMQWRLYFLWYQKTVSEHDKGQKMILHLREFDVNGQKIIMGHDRETGKRYYCQKVFSIETEKNTVELNGHSIYIGKFDNTSNIVNQIKTIFWIE